jgi:hypothetical protein
MTLVITLAILMALIGLGGYYIGPGLGYDGAASVVIPKLVEALY